MSKIFSINDAQIDPFGVMWGTQFGDATKGESIDVLNGAMLVAQAAKQPGDDDDLWVKIGGLIFEPLRWTPSGDGQIITGDCALLGVKVLGGSTPTLDLYDGTDTSGTPVFTGLGTLTVGQFYPIIGAAGGAPGAAARCVNGLFGNQGGTSPDFLFWVIQSQPAS